MRFLIDAPLSPEIAQALREAGHDALHVRELGLRDAEDSVIFTRAAEENRIIVSADTDFGALLAFGGETKPSVILFRVGPEQRSEQQMALLLRNLPQLAGALAKGCIVVFGKRRIRVRSLPIGE